MRGPVHHRLLDAGQPADGHRVRARRRRAWPPTAAIRSDAYAPTRSAATAACTTWLGRAADKPPSPIGPGALLPVRLPSAVRPAIAADGVPTWGAVRPTTPLDATWRDGPRSIAIPTMATPRRLDRMPLFWRAPARRDTDLTRHGLAHPWWTPQRQAVLQDDHTP
ncbi:MAG: hypothetical protein U0641_02745 [Anaerolineae bacterium]